MHENYTHAANSRCFDLIDDDLFAIRQEIEDTREDTSARQWREKLGEIARQYVLSSRFALMRILCARACGCSPSDAERQPPFTIRMDGGQPLSFEGLARYRSWEELRGLLEQLAGEEGEPDGADLDALRAWEREDALRPFLNPDGLDFGRYLSGLTGTADGLRELRRMARRAADQAGRRMEEEHRRYLAVALEIAGRQAGAREDWPGTVALCCQALRSGGLLEEYCAARIRAGDRAADYEALRRRARQLCLPRLSREEALRLGHLLDFTLQEMSWFLLRVFDYEDGFHYNASRDLIEAYGFLTGAGWQEVARWQEVYRRAARGAAKAAGDERSLDWTQRVELSLPQLVEKWSVLPDQREQLFYDWLLCQTPYLDLPSHSAARVYRALAVWADRMLAEGCRLRDSSALRDAIETICRSADRSEEAGEVLCEGGARSARRCRALAKRLMRENKELFTYEPDLAKAWRTVTADRQGQLRLTVAGSHDNRRNRLDGLLMGEVQVEKGDLLYLLWFIFSLFWLEHPIADTNDLYNSLADFCEAAELALDWAHLPGFYPPHLLEQSMMLSIVRASEETGHPADVYTEVCASLIRPRKRRKRRG